MLLYFLWAQSEHIPAADLFGMWIIALTVVNAVSLVIDIVDVVRYLAGERRETVQGL